MPRRVIPIAATLLVTLAMAGAITWWLRREPPTQWPQTRGVTRDAAFYESIAERWAALPIAPVSPGSEAALATMIADAVTDPKGLLTASQRRAFADTLAHEIVLRGVADPEAYPSFVASDKRTRFIGPADTDQWKINNAWLEGRYARTWATDEAEDALRFFVNDVVRAQTYLFDGVAMPSDDGPGGLDIRAYRVRTEEQFAYESSKAMPDDAFNFLFVGPSSNGALRLREPVTSLAEVLARDGKATMISAHVIVRIKAGVAFNFLTSWFWDPALSHWQCYQMRRMGKYYADLYY